MLTGCGHSFCSPCASSLRVTFNGKYRCPQCRKLSSTCETNFALKSALESLQMMCSTTTNAGGIVGDSCSHIQLVGDNDLELCPHCNSKFCPSCMLSHKVFLRLEAEIIASNVNFY